MKTLERLWPLDILLFVSPAYWSNAVDRRNHARRIERALRAAAGEFGDSVAVCLLDSDEAVAEAAAEADGEGRAAVFVPLSGGVQPWMLRAAEQRKHCALLNAYLPGLFEEEIAHALLRRNAHPAATDFHARMQRQGRASAWLDSLEAFRDFVAGWQGSQRLRHAAVLLVGETEPWVINSCRDPARLTEKWGTRVVSLGHESLYRAMNDAAAAPVRSLAHDWVARASALVDVEPRDVESACRVTVAMERLLEEHGADALAMACFTMIGQVDTTSCLALSALNDSGRAIGACEGDLDAAVTLFLLRAMGADFVWIGNPIIHPGRFLQLVHCTAPRSTRDSALDYRLLRHHESGRGVAPEVALPVDRDVTLARIGDDLNRLFVCQGTSRQVERAPTCHTQALVEVGDTRSIVHHLLGTHLVMSYGRWRGALLQAARFLDLEPVPPATGPVLLHP